jgi:Icc-related predicted phosphoesterase
VRILITADLHHNHARSRASAEEIIGKINSTGGDVLLVVGDAAVGEGTALEECLNLFHFKGPKLFVPGNHELWTRERDTMSLIERDLPARVKAIGWQWVPDHPFLSDDLAIVGSCGWYDYSFAQPSLGIPARFYREKISPGAAAHVGGFAHLFDPSDDISPHARQIVARWNDGKFIRTDKSDFDFLDWMLQKLESHLATLRDKRQIIAAIHHLPFEELLPPSHSAQWDFAKAYLGSKLIGELLLKFDNITHAYCGHSHFATDAMVRHIHAINIGSGYREKHVLTLDV